MYRPALECFEEADECRASHLLFEDFQQERTDIPKFVFYLFLLNEYSHLFGIAPDGNSGYKIKFIHKAKIYAFKGENYQEDCRIRISKTMSEFSTARLRPEGVCIHLTEDRVEEIRTALKNELRIEVRVFVQEITESKK